MTNDSEFTSLVKRRNDIIQRLAKSHVKLAKKVLSAVKSETVAARAHDRKFKSQSRSTLDVVNSVKFWKTGNDKEREETEGGSNGDSDEIRDLLVRTMSPFVDNPQTQPTSVSWLAYASRPETTGLPSHDSTPVEEAPIGDTLWIALSGLPRSMLDPYQPLINLSALFRGKTVPAIDYYTAKFNLLTSLVTERSASHADSLAEYDGPIAHLDETGRQFKYLSSNSITVEPRASGDSDWRVEEEVLSLDSIRERLEAPDADPALILHETINSKGYRAFASSAQGRDAVELIEMLDAVSLTSYIFGVYSC